VIGLQFGNGFNNPKYHDWLESHRESRPAPLFTSSAPLLASLQAVNDKEAKLYPPVPEDVPEELRMPVDQLVAVLDHWIEVVGEDHVSLGSDFDGWLPVPKDMHDIGDYQLLITAMRRHGYSDERVRKIAGLNLLRVIRQVTQNSNQSDDLLRGWRIRGLLCMRHPRESTCLSLCLQTSVARWRQEEEYVPSQRSGRLELGSSTSILAR